MMLHVFFCEQSMSVSLASKSDIRRLSSRATLAQLAPLDMVARWDCDDRGTVSQIKKVGGATGRLR